MRLQTLLVVLLGVLIAGCTGKPLSDTKPRQDKAGGESDKSSKETPKAATPSGHVPVKTGIAQYAKTHAELFQQEIAVRKEAVGLLATVKDVKSAKEVKPRLEELFRELQAVGKRRPDLGAADNAVVEQHDPEVKQLVSQTVAERDRIMAIPGAWEILQLK
jgi:hypothetical protein